MGFEGICIYGHASMAKLHGASHVFVFLLYFLFILLSCWMLFLNTATAVIVMIKSIKAWVADVLNCIITIFLVFQHHMHLQKVLR